MHDELAQMKAAVEPAMPDTISRGFRISAAVPATALRSPSRHPRPRHPSFHPPHHTGTHPLRRHPSIAISAIDQHPLFFLEIFKDIAYKG
jgi:hypothetical protein